MQPQKITAKFLEKWTWKGEKLELAYNPYDQSRSQLRPDYNRLIGVEGKCTPIQMLDQTTGEPVTKYLLLAKVKDPAEPGSLAPDKYYRCWRIYNIPVEPKAVDWRTVVFYEIKQDEPDMNEGQHFINSLLKASSGMENEQPKDDPDSAWAEDFARIQQGTTEHAPHPQQEPVTDGNE